MTNVQMNSIKYEIILSSNDVTSMFSIRHQNLFKLSYYEAVSEKIQ